METEMENEEDYEEEPSIFWNGTTISKLVEWVFVRLILIY